MGNNWIERREEEITSSYMELMMYNKTLEIEEKNAQGKISEEEREQYVRIFRTEVRVKNSKLNSNKNKKMPKKLEYYFDSEITRKIYSDFVEKIFGSNDFYRIDVAINIIKMQKDIRETTKAKMCRLISLVNERGYSEAKREYIKKYSESSFRNMQKKIETLGINILTFPKFINGQLIDKEKICNFTLLENGIEDSV